MRLQEVQVRLAAKEKKKAVERGKGDAALPIRSVQMRFACKHIQGPKLPLLLSSEAEKGSGAAEPWLKVRWQVGLDTTERAPYFWIELEAGHRFILFAVLQASLPHCGFQLWKQRKGVWKCGREHGLNVGEDEE